MGLCNLLYFTEKGLELDRRPFSMWLQKQIKKIVIFPK